MRRRFKKRLAAQGTSAFLLATILVSCLFLAINTSLVRAAQIMLTDLSPEILGHAKTRQAMVLMVPLLMLALEWSLVDRLVYWFSGDARSDRGQQG